MPKVYIVEDDENIKELVLYALESSGFVSYGCESGSGLIQKMEKEPPDLILLDIMLPGEDGIAILKKIRGLEAYKNIPVVMLTAKGSEYDRIKGLEYGADDYIVKPFSVLELIARIKAVLRRTQLSPEEKLLTFKELSLDPKRRLVLSGGKNINLTLKEFDLLNYFMKNEGLVLSRDKIMNSIWGYDFEGESRTVDMHVKTLRQKLGDSGVYIKTVRGIGYKLGEM